AGAELVETDIRDASAVRDLLDRVRPEAVFHLAAQIDVRKSAADPAFDARVNVEGTINLLAASHAAEVGRFVNTSTGGAIYGEGRIVPAPEDHPVAPEAPYGQSKFAAEGYCELFRRLHGLNTVSLRYGNVYGSRQDPHAQASFEPDHHPERPGEVKRIALDCTRAREELDWESRVSLADGLERTLASIS